MAKRLTAAPDGSVIEKRPSRTRSAGLAKRRRSSVKAIGPSTTARASSLTSSRPLPSLAVSDSGASEEAAISVSVWIAIAATGVGAAANTARDTVGTPLALGELAVALGDGEHAATAAARDSAAR